ncbi:MAG: murein biosynthesis integral membrane protein MurJ [Anaerolineae bacterium]|nr:MAG: murein biosynthesis integral membrane protein MurJ [Anaerolineae bacterium]
MEQIPDPSTPEPYPSPILDVIPDLFPNDHPEFSAERREEDSGIVRAAAVLAAGNVASRVLGLAREIVKANLFGTSPLLAAFQAAAYVPTSLFDLIIGGMVNSSLVPVFSDYTDKDKRDELWHVLSMVLSAATIVLLGVILVVELLAPQVAWLVGTVNFTEHGLNDLSVTLIRMTTPAVLFLGIASILTGALYALKRFTIPAFIGAAFNGTIVVVALLNPEEIRSLVWGLLLGSVLQVLLQLPALRDARLRWTLDLKHPAIRRIILLYIPILAGLIVNQLAIMLSYNLAIRTGDQSLNYMSYATTLYQFPLGLVVTALSIATLPTLSRQAAGDLSVFKQTLGDGLRLVLALILPATAGLFALAPFIIGLLFEHGRFTATDTATTALVLRVYLIGMPFAAADQMLVFASYARKDTWRPALVGFIAILIYSLTAVALLGTLGLLSLMVADAVKHVVHTLIMLWLLRRQLGGLAGNPVMRSAVKSLAAAMVTGAAAFAVAQLISELGPAFSRSYLLPVLAGGVAGLLAYTVSVFAFNIKETRALPGLLRRRNTSENSGE